MSIDTILGAISDFQAHIRRDRAASDSAYTIDQAQRLMLTTDCWRDALIRGDKEGFSASLDRTLAQQPDLADWILVDLFERLGCEDRKGFDAILDAGDE